MLRLDIHAADKATRDRMTLQYKRLGLDLVWCEIDENTNRVQIVPSKRPRRRYDKPTYATHSTCISCGETKPRAEFDLTTNNRAQEACRVCATAPERKCRKCGEVKSIDCYFRRSGWICQDCKKLVRQAYVERKQK